MIELKSHDSIFLTICIPTYNRSKEIQTLLSTIPESSSLEVVICDDGSTDNTKDTISKYMKILNIEYIYQQNQGRAWALKRAIEHARGQYIILMDSDDFFIEGWYDFLKRTIKSIEVEGKEKNITSFVFGTQLIQNNSIKTNMPPDGAVTNFIALRADFKIKYDLKEVVRSDILKVCLYDINIGVRRVPTSLIWAKVSMISNCLCVSKVIAVKEYLPGGMSANILELKSKNSLPLVNLYELLSVSNKYKSITFRVRSMLLWSRYSYHSKQIKINYWWQYFFIFLGFFLYFLDKIKLFIRRL